tara:strand:+ start:227 stop:562 length:336 start_codon:yes stop_codon:yes gene_type:complete
MINLSIKFLIIIFSFAVLTNKAIGENSSEYYLNDFYTKSNEASKILKEIEKDLKNGIRDKSCLRQKKAASLGLSANESLIKVFELEENNKIPFEAIKSSQRKWESLLKTCQ